MDSITEMDEASVDLIHKATAAAVHEIAEKFGLMVQQKGKGMYDPTEGTFRLAYTFSLDDADQRRFKVEAEYHGLKAEDLGLEFMKDGNQYRIVGMAGGRKSQPFIIESGGKRYMTSADALQIALGRLTVEEMIERDFSVMVWGSGLRPEDLGREVALADGITGRIVGWHARSKKRPILIDVGDGRKATATTAEVAEALGRKVNQPQPVVGMPF